MTYLGMISAIVHLVGTSKKLPIARDTPNVVPITASIVWLKRNILASSIVIK